MAGFAFKTNFSSPGIQGLSEIKKPNKSLEKSFENDNQEKTKSFMDHLTESVNSVNDTHKVADDMAANIASGKSQNLHETMLAMTQAELGFNFMVQVRNKALEAYQEISRMQV